MRIHWEESATTKTAPFRRNPLGAGGFRPQALSLVGHDEKTSLHSSLRACNPKTPARGPRDFCHGLLGYFRLIGQGPVPSVLQAGFHKVGVIPSAPRSRNSSL